MLELDSSLGVGVGDVLRSPACQRLHALKLLGLTFWDENDDGVKAVADYFTSTRLPDLRDLSLCAIPRHGVALLGRALVALVHHGTAPNLQSLELQNFRLAGAEVRLLGVAIRRKAWPELLKLGLRGAELRPDDVEALTSAVLEGGGCPDLKTLDLSLNSRSFGDGGARALADALKAGAFPALEVLNLRMNVIRGQGAMALAHALSTRQGLTQLDLNHQYLGDEAVSELIRGLGVESQLGALNLTSVGLTARGVEAMMHVMAKGACARLRHLVLAENNLEDQGLRCLAEGLEAGAGKGLRFLDLGTVDGCLEGADAIAHVLENGGCPTLEKVFVSGARAYVKVKQRLWPPRMGTGPPMFTNSL